MNPETFAPAKSGLIHSTFHDGAAMLVCFQQRGKPGAVWRYHDVPADLYTKFLEAESLGRFFLSNIKNVFRSERVS